MISSPVEIAAGGVTLLGDLTLPPGASSAVLFAHGSGSSRLSPRNRDVASALQAAGIGTLLMDLLTGGEERADGESGGSLRFDIQLLARRLSATTRWLAEGKGRGLELCYFGASTGAAAALTAAARRGSQVAAIVSRGGRPDLAGDALERVHAPTLLIVGGDDPAVLELNQQAMARLRCPCRLAIIPGATHLFEEPGALDQVAELATAWFLAHAG